MKRKNIERAIIGVSLIFVVILFIYFFKDITVPLFKMELRGNYKNATNLLKSRGVLGSLSVILIEALQMIVVFIPAEFIQVSAGLSYPFYIALILCDMGVCLGATVIFVLVRSLHFNAARLMRKEKIDRISGKAGDSSTVMLMYLLFVTPIIPFGAICYYISGKNISYRRYIITVATGVIPSIITSNLIGVSAKAFVLSALPLWLLVVIIILLMCALFVILYFLLDKMFFGSKDGTPDSATYYLFFKFVNLVRGRKQRLHIDNEKLSGIKPPYVVLCNHASFYDFYYVKKLLGDTNAAYIVNSHILSLPILNRLGKKAGFITKKLFYPDKAALKMVRTLKKGYPVVVFPEGRLSLDSRNYPIVESAARLYGKLGVPLVLANISGAYFANPKWRKKFYKSDIFVSVKRVLSSEEIKQMNTKQLEAVINDAMRYNDSVLPRNRYTKKDMAKGLENVLYRCADCGELYSTAGNGNELLCTVCGARHRILDNYLFDDAAKSIPDYLDKIKALERPHLDSVCLETKVKTKIFTQGKYRARKEKGECTLTKDGFSYRSAKTDFFVPIENLPALAFSCNSEFELYYRDELYYFYPVDNPRRVVRWSLITDLLYEVRNGKEEENPD